LILELPPALLILDLDETLIHSSEQELERVADFRVGSYFTYKRPHLEAFLEVCFEHFEVAVWTASTEDYASEIVTKIFGTRALKFFWSRERCTLRYFEDIGDRVYTKPLTKVRKLGFDLSRVIAVDDKAENFYDAYSNLVQVKRFLGDSSDTELQKLAQYLPLLAKESNVRKLEKRRWRNALTP
jgi:carboxy-terminal domain RNA polymerase II polypeptide A small phosphatase